MPMTSRTPVPAPRRARWALLVATVPALACHCESADVMETSPDTSSSGASNDTWTTSTDESTGASVDLSRWIGRYHYQDPWLEFGERGDPLGPHMLSNFEIHADSTAFMLYDDCALDEPITIAYEWTPGELGWLDLHPGEGESSLRVWAGHDLDSVRVHLVEPCRALQFEVDGIIDHWLLFHPGASCWTDRCTTGNLMEVDYCDGEEPPPCP